MAKRKVSIQGIDVRFIFDKDDFISITDIAKSADDRTDTIIQNWMRNGTNLEFLATWEKVHNPNFNPIGYDGIAVQASRNNFVISVKKWIEAVGAIGIYSSAGRYGGTYAHSDIALQFATWLSPVFYLYLIKDYQRLKQEEVEGKSLEWDVRRLISKANYRIHTEAVRENLVPVLDWNTKREAIYMASEADVLNLALFGATAKQWKQENPELNGNMRDHATAEQLLVLANLEALNAEYLELRLSKEERIKRLNEKAQLHMNILLDTAAGKELIQRAAGKKKLK